MIEFFDKSLRQSRFRYASSHATTARQPRANIILIRSAPCMAHKKKRRDKPAAFSLFRDSEPGGYCAEDLSTDLEDRGVGVAVTQGRTCSSKHRGLFAQHVECTDTRRDVIGDVVARSQVEVIDGIECRLELVRCIVIIRLTKVPPRSDHRN